LFPAASEFLAPEITNLLPESDIFHFVVIYFAAGPKCSTLLQHSSLSDSRRLSLLEIHSLMEKNFPVTGCLKIDKDDYKK
jgi:hypothetical protein